ncbi:MAG: hypothetical protein JWR69_4379 [Pedosphaera sp.]|nr:hypothetical protein [Pedosphaera sp.]
MGLPVRILALRVLDPKGAEWSGERRACKTLVLEYSGNREADWRVIRVENCKDQETQVLGAMELQARSSRRTRLSGGSFAGLRDCVLREFPEYTGDLVSQQC